MAYILVIDDDPAVRVLMREALEPLGHDVIEAGDGKQGMRLFHERRPDLVITNIFMPEQEGIETIEQLRESDSPPPILAVSGGGRFGYTEVLDRALLLGATAALRKPFTVSQLRSIVSSLLEFGSEATP
ncbi:MAG: response regulator [Candidatus Dadabacteria bacterium]|nr:MAG: response regulator [Candidatus Dadabacteria bacterium]